MLSYGVIARTQKSFDGLPTLAEITHHQLIVATLIASDKTPFFAGLLHDALKPLLKLELEKERRGWRWLHLDGLEVGGTKVNLEEIVGQSLRRTLTEIFFI